MLEFGKFKIFTILSVILIGAFFSAPNFMSEQLNKELVSARKVLFESNFKHKMGQLKESHLLKTTRKEIARVKTELAKNGK